ncbi:hypothetical protein [Ammoniphilus sp. 3BR4]|uniref:sunset domain-containing protein n=1 Tax=Ammoniphilus sp. 3BR4 TaxID=3158265 RepID=UPI003467C34C
MKRKIIISVLSSIFVLSAIGVASANHGVINDHSYSYCNGGVKGNISNKGERIYHVPGGQFYNKTKAEYCFKTTEQARKAGFRASKK